jgi:hypothetical protein
VQDHPQPERPPLGGRHEPVELVLDLDRVVVLGQPEAVRHARHVGVDGQPREAEHHAADHVARLAADTRQRDEVVEVGGHLTVEPLDQLARHPDQVAGLRLVEAGRADDLLELVRIGPSEVVGPG